MSFKNYVPSAAAAEGSGEKINTLWVEIFPSTKMLGWIQTYACLLPGKMHHIYLAWKEKGSWFEFYSFQEYSYLLKFHSDI